MKELKEKKIEAILILTVIFGFVLRVINANTRTIFGDPPHFILHAINFLNSGLLVTWDQSTFLWYALTNIFYNIFGITQFASRFSSVLFGTLTILMMYLFVKEFSGNKKVALLSAIIYAFAPTFIFNSADEHDISTLFFIVGIFYTLIRGLKRNSKVYILLSGIFFGVACMWKAYTPLVFIAYVGMIFYYHKTKIFDIKKNKKLLVGILIIIFLLVTPVLVYNYSNFKHNSVPTFFFVKFFKGFGLNSDKIDSLYGWVSSGEISKSSISLQRIFIAGSPGNPSELYSGLTYSLWSNGPILCLLALVGIIFMFRRMKKDGFAKDYLIFFLLYFTIPFLFLIDTNILAKHFVQFVAFSIPITAYLLFEVYKSLDDKYKINNYVNKNIYALFVILILVEFFVIMALPFNGEMFYSKNPEAQLIDYKKANIPQESLIILDDRIYNQLSGWMFNDRYYLPVSSLEDFMNYNKESTNQYNVPVFIVECASDNGCGWAVNEQLNQSEEAFFSNLNNRSIPIVFIAYNKLNNLKYYNPFISFISDVKPTEQFKVYKLDMTIDLNLAKQVKNQYSYFLYPLAYKNKKDEMFKNFQYNPEGIFEKLINQLAWMIFYLEIALSILAIVFVLFEFYRENKASLKNETKETQ